MLRGEICLADKRRWGEGKGFVRGTLRHLAVQGGDSGTEVPYYVDNTTMGKKCRGFTLIECWL